MAFTSLHHSARRKLVFVALTLSAFVYYGEGRHETSTGQTDIYASQQGRDSLACSESRPAELVNPGSFSSPSQPDGNYTRGAHCSWLLIAPNHHVVRLEFRQFDLEDGYPCVYANVTVHDGRTDHQGDFIRMFCGHESPSIVHSSSQYLLVTFKTGLKGSGRGIVADYSFVDVTGQACNELTSPMFLNWSTGGFTSPEFPQAYPPNQICSWVISPPEPAFRLNFTEWSIGEECTDASVMIYDGPVRNESALLGRYCGNTLPRNKGATAGSVLVYFRSLSPGSSIHHGFQARFEGLNITTWACGISRPAEIDWDPGIIISPTTESSLCRWRFRTTSSSVVKLEIIKFDLPYCTNCGCASLSFHDGETEHAPLLGKYCGSGWTTNFIVSGGNTAYLLYKSYMLAPNAGFQIKYSFYDIAEHACSSSRPVNLTEKSGLITSPNYGSGVYPDNANCQWRIIALEGEVIRLDFLTFRVEFCPACSCDRLSVFNGYSPNSTLIRHFCDFIPPMPITSTVNSVYLRFTTDRDRGANGFKIQYQVQNLSDLACGVVTKPTTMILEPGVIMSPRYGDWYYPANSNCQWIISAPHPQVVEVEFVDVEIEHGHYCEFDYLTLHDGATTDSKLLARICGSELPEKITSSGSKILLTFISNDIIEQTGFKLKYVFKDPVRSSMTTTVVIVCGTIAALGFICLLGYCLNCPQRLRKACVGNERQPTRPDRNRRQNFLPDINDLDTHLEYARQRHVMHPPSYDEVDRLPPSYEESVFPYNGVPSDRPPAYSANNSYKYNDLPAQTIPTSNSQPHSVDRDVQNYPASSADHPESTNGSNMNAGSSGLSLVGSAAVISDGMLLPSNRVFKQHNRRSAANSERTPSRSSWTDDLAPSSPGFYNIGYTASREALHRETNRSRQEQPSSEDCGSEPPRTVHRMSDSPGGSEMNYATRQTNNQTAGTISSAKKKKLHPRSNHAESESGVTSHDAIQQGPSRGNRPDSMAASSDKSHASEIQHALATTDNDGTTV